MTEHYKYCYIYSVHSSQIENAAVLSHESAMCDKKISSIQCQYLIQSNMRKATRFKEQ